jgi:hypothetical protein
MNKRPGTEKRRHLRRSIGVVGTVHLPDGKSVACEVSDISETGAMLLLEVPVEHPSEFMLEIGHNAARRRCHRMRQEGATAGVRFPDRPLNRA